MSLYGSLAETVREGKACITGRAEFDSAGEYAVSTPYATIDAVLMTLESATEPTGPEMSYSVSDNVVTFHAWDGAGSGVSGDSFSYMIIGRRR